MKNEMIKSKEHLSIPRLQTLITSMIKQSDNREFLMYPMFFILTSFVEVKFTKV